MALESRARLGNDPDAWLWRSARAWGMIGGDTARLVTSAPFGAKTG